MAHSIDSAPADSTSQHRLSAPEALYCQRDPGLGPGRRVFSGGAREDFGPQKGLGSQSAVQIQS